MKTVIYILSFITLMSCSRDSENTKNPTITLPAETQVGANTFGVTINGKVYIPRDPTGVSVGPTAKGVIFWRSPDLQHTYDELEIKDGASSTGFKMIIHLQNLFQIGQGEYILKQSNFHNGIDSIPFNHIYFKIWDSNISNYAYYGSIENLGSINVTRYDFANRIFSGNFSGKFVRYDNPNDYIIITDGRFDINWNTIQNHPFP
ncbi:DUF5025 domain-containing protein [Amniculibacterium aquaticum]|uniref:DUF5025 domain-containing protein n=1 Tax=Amniculibacterium aquaticum TaxID=2479858 RepID=UPI000F5A2EA8|nr:DUF5025 domain-containing protein [Amniculibacterium aquaticum]